MNIYLSFRVEICHVSHHKSRKYHLFIREPMSNKSVTNLVGVGKVLGRRFAARGFQEASTLFGQFHLVKKVKVLFMIWVMKKTGSNMGQAKDIYQCLFDWCKEFL